MELRALVYVEGEWSPSLLCNEPGIPAYQVHAANTGVALCRNILRTISEQKIEPEEILFIGATDRSVEAARALPCTKAVEDDEGVHQAETQNRNQVAVAGYVNTKFPGQRFKGLPMVIEGFEEVDFAFLNRIYERCHKIPWTITKTRRCVIRELSLSDLDELRELYDRPGITWRLDAQGRRIPGFIEPLYSPEEERDYQEAYIANMYGYYGYGMWVITDRKTGKLMGRAGLEHREFGSGTELELGYLVDPDVQQQGIATEVCTAILDYAGKNLDFPRVNALTSADNRASIGLLSKLDFQYMEDVCMEGQWYLRYTYNF